MRTLDDQASERERIGAEAIALKIALMKAMGEHGARYGMLDPQVAVSALGSTVIDLFAQMREAGYPAQMLASFAAAAELYFQHLPTQIAAAIAGRPLPASGVTVDTRGAGARPATHKGGRA